MIGHVTIRGIELLAVPNQTQFVDFLLNHGDIRTGKLVAINAEKVIISEQNPQLRRLLHNTEYKYADGISIVCAIKRKYPQHRQVERIAGVELWEAMLMAGIAYDLPVFLVGGKPDVLAETAEKLCRLGVRIVGSQDGYFTAEDQDSVIERIRQSGAKFVSVAMGSPKQEMFIESAQQIYPDTLYMGVGGSYDVFVGKVKRAPQIWRQLGLEWLFRLWQQPTRWQRQLRLMKYAYYYLTKQL
ncbi:lipopolysaccharide N-acetylmannosaminouronosyltransferase [Muribacter muris]|uniref:Lipopolysaccharide N-acetylmannosaminouronosyltransferase n=1 Tax=Muribacter muris TaxID=67855 RepID=A0A4Y9JZK4_9PAST|nr:lipopolysaccharide N-acetylmannosaminouronosyltransferase [Muribacter muris]MBF0785079.1 lipopolysaccharide N-acetylmannosaminouronosyltransferase [Muribacter muris]MBF0826706.1 lipopolysaccharide N-acetylmannosaminouronosyltransferase [Muribacter muris]TFV10319.1 lipopolysaccharide N-acetylmannosaminouronosyltransferase [Muribacter muris]